VRARRPRQAGAENLSRSIAARRPAMTLVMAVPPAFLHPSMTLHWYTPTRDERIVFKTLGGWPRESMALERVLPSGLGRW
jgi:hypothetical protein